MAHQMTSTEMKQCADECGRCHDVCLETLSHCLEMGGDHVERAHVTLMMDCIQICEMSKNFLLRKSSLHAQTCRACAEVCEACAKDCERLGDEHMKRCAEQCRKCAESCRRMAA